MKLGKSKIVLSAVIVALGALSTGAAAQTMPKFGGSVLTDTQGMTLYTFDKDEKDKSNCYDKCAAAWAPLKAAADAKADDEWSVVDRTDGTKMWAYDGHPLYTFVDDKKPGDVTGDGKGGVWHVAKGD